MPIKVGLLGFGRTGSIVAKEIVSDPALSLQWVCRKTIPANLNFASHALGFDQSFAPFISFDELTADFLNQFPVDLVVDFSSSSASSCYPLFADAQIKVITAISKYDSSDYKNVELASIRTAVLASPNITLGINWLMIASKVLKQIIPHADIEVVEEHFRAKKEISGTALKLASHLDLEPSQHVNSIRVGGIVGRHEVIFGLPYQTIRITHESISRSAFGTGAVFAGKWLIDKSPGLYTMEQVIHEKFVTKMNELQF